MKKAIVFTIALGFSAAIGAQQYKWVDQNGRVQYGDSPPAGAKATPLAPPAGRSSAAPPGDTAGKKDGKKAPQLTPEQAFQKRQKDRQEADQKTEKERADAEISRTNCESARSQLRQLKSGERMSTVSKSGERGYMDDAQRAAESSRAEKAIADWCK